MMYLKHLSLLLNVVLLHASPVDFIADGRLQSEENKNGISEASDMIYRLTDEVTPVSYDLKMVPDLEKFTFRGTVEIEVKVQFSTNTITLHSKRLKITSCQVFTERGYTVKSTHKLEEINELLIIETEQLQFGTSYTLKIEFEGVLNDDMRGFYRSSYTTNGKKYWLAVTQFETSSAREAFPCFDEPRFRTPFKISIAHYDSQNAVSNMPYQTRSYYKDPSVNYRVWTRFQTTPPMATYLVAFMVSEFTFVSEGGKIKVYARPDAAKHGSYALQQGIRLLNQMEGHIGIPHKLPKLDVVALPDFDMGAMENWGMTTYRERFILMDGEKPCSAIHKRRITAIISHEFTHQWFGDLVTPAWWDYLWLNEGFARYYEFFTTAVVEPTWDMDKFFVVTQVQFALWNEIGAHRAMTTSVAQKHQLDGIFDVISYPKAASVIRMFEHMVSPKVFRSALNKYLKDGVEKKYGTVVPEDLFNAFAEQVHFTTLSLPEHVSIPDIMKLWTENIGYPLIMVSRCYHHGHVTVTQTTYKSTRTSKSLPEQKWIVPLTYTTKSQLEFSNTKPTQWSQGDKRTNLPETLPNSDWILFNLQQTGYYRVNYDLKNWHLLIDQLLLDHEKIHVLNRAQLIDDSFALAEDDKINYQVPLSLIQYLPKEKDVFPWITAATAINRLFAKYDDTSVGPLFKTFIQGIVEKSDVNFGFDIKETDSHAIKVGKPIFLELACRIGHKTCIDKAAEEYNKNKNDPNGVQPDLKKVVFCSVLRYSEDKQNAFDNLWKLYTRSDIVNDKTIILESLSCVNDEKIVKKVLYKLIDSKNQEIRKQDHVYVYASLFRETLAVNSGIEFLQEKISTLSELDNHGVSVYENILKKIKANVKTDQQITMLKELENKSKTLDQAKYGYLTSLIQDAQTKGSNIVKENEKKAQILLPAVRHILSPDNTDDTNDEKSQTTPSPTSRAPALVSSKWTNLILFGVFFRYGLSFLCSS